MVNLDILSEIGIMKLYMCNKISNIMPGIEAIKFTFLSILNVAVILSCQYVLYACYMDVRIPNIKIVKKSITYACHCSAHQHLHCVYSQQCVCHVCSWSALAQCQHRRDCPDRWGQSPVQKTQLWEWQCCLLDRAVTVVPKCNTVFEVLKYFQLYNKGQVIFYKTWYMINSLVPTLLPFSVYS